MYSIELTEEQKAAIARIERCGGQVIEAIMPGRFVVVPPHMSAEYARANSPGSTPDRLTSIADAFDIASRSRMGTGKGRGYRSHSGRQYR